MKYSFRIMSIVVASMLSGCDKINEIKLPALENYWTLEEEIFRVNPGKGTGWVENLNAVASTSTAETVLLIQFKAKPDVPGIYKVRSYSPAGSVSLARNECSIAVLDTKGGNNFSSTGKDGDEMEVIDVGGGKFKYFFAGIDVRSGSKGSLLTASLIEK